MEQESAQTYIQSACGNWNGGESTAASEFGRDYLIKAAKLDPKFIKALEASNFLIWIYRDLGKGAVEAGIVKLDEIGNAKRQDAEVQLNYSANFIVSDFKSVSSEMHKDTLFGTQNCQTASNFCHSDFPIEKIVIAVIINATVSIKAFPVPPLSVTIERVIPAEATKMMTKTKSIFKILFEKYVEARK